MKILVTGANGYLGQGIVKSIIDSGNDVIATDFRDTNIDKRAIAMPCNLFEIENPYEYLPSLEEFYGKTSNWAFKNARKRMFF